jgi:hypothetical protein
VACPHPRAAACTAKRPGGVSSRQEGQERVGPWVNPPCVIRQRQAVPRREPVSRPGSRREGEPVNPLNSARGGSVARRRWLGATAAAAMFTVSLAVPSAGRATLDVSAVQPLSAVGSPGELARLEARAAALSRQYRGEVVLLTDAESAAKATTATAVRLRRQLGHAHRELAWLAAVSYMSGAQDPTVAILGGGDPQRMLEASATVEYVTQQRSASELALKQFMAAEQRAEQAAQAKVGELRRLVAALAGQRRKVGGLMARFRPQSPTIGGDRITARMRQVRNEIDRRFGPFTAIGCYRPEATGEHPLGRACDFMLSSGGVMPSAAGVQRGYAIAAWAHANASRLGIMYIIYRQRIWDIRMASPGWVPMEDRGSITANHFDHVHISVF